jgi:phospholipid/cholesterol/gamma-HCH transport system substrate-binding protein
MTAQTRNLFDHRKEIAWSALKAGIVISAGLALFFIAIFFSGAMGSLFAPRANLYVRFADARGLRPGSPVWLLGVEIGSIKEIQFADTVMEVKLSVKRSALNFIYSDAKASILNMGLLGDKYVAIEPGRSSTNPIKPGSHLRGETAVTMEEILSASVKSASGVNSFISRLDSIVVSINRGEGSLAKLLKSPEIYAEIRSSTSSIAQLLQGIQRNRGTLGHLIQDSLLYQELTSAGASFGEVGRALNDSSLLFGRLMSDGRIHTMITATLENAARVTGRIDSGKGVLGTLTRNDSLARSMENLVSNLNGLVDSIKKNPKKYFKISVF